MSLRLCRDGNHSRLSCFLFTSLRAFFFSFFLAVAFLLSNTLAYATTKTWTNGSSDGLWSTAANWSPSGAPTSSDVAVFDATSSDNCTLDVSPTLQQLTMTNGYTGTLSMGSQTMTLTSGLNLQPGGSFNAGTSTIDIASTVGLFDVVSTQSFYNLVISSGNTVRYNLSISSDLSVQNDFTLTSVGNLGCGFACSKRILVYGNATSNDADGWNATGVVQMAGTANQQVLGSGILTQFIVDKPSGTVSLSSFGGGFGPVSGGYCRLASANQGALDLGGITVDGYVFQVQGGTLSGTGTINGTVSCSGGTLSPGGNAPGCISINGDFTMLSGSALRIDIQGTSACSQYDQIAVTGTVTLNNPTITGGTTFQTVSPLTIIDNDDTDAITGTFNGLADNDTVTLSGRKYSINYNASGDNDVVLTTINLPPVAQCAYIQRNIGSPCAPANVSAAELDNGSYDPEGGSLTFTMSPSGPFEAGFYFVDLTVTDTLGASSTCTAYVEVVDTVFPIITTPCPGNITVCGSQAVTWTLPVAIDADNCTVNRYIASSDTVTFASNPGDVFPVGTTTILYIFEDGSGTNSFCQFDIHVLPIPDVSITQSQLSGACQGAQLLTATVANSGSLSAPLYYSWSGTVVANTPTVQATQNGTYALTVYDSDDCFGTASVTLTVDATDPVPDVASLADINAQCSVTITTFPTATDNCAGTITATTTNPLTYTAQGSYTITWTYDDGNGNTVTQEQNVIVQDTTHPVPNLSSLPTISGQCSATVTTVPTATDNCVGTITATTSNALSYSTPGSHTITWTYNDGNGNTTTQTQTVIIQDNIAPVPNVTSLPNVQGQCSATVTTIPTATDNCAGTITATTTDALTYNTPGSHTITWHYNDGNGNSSIQTQVVIVQDNVAPVPTVAVLPVIRTQCSATLTAPTATDNCAGTITATTSGATTISTQGTRTITWVYNDGNGNSSTQTQTLIVADTIAPVPNLSVLPVLRAQCSLTVTSPPTATDNCVGTVIATTTNPLTYSAQGSYTIVWRYNDGNGNIRTQNQSVVIDDTIPPVPNVSSLPVIRAQCSVSVTATPTATDNCAGTITATTTNTRNYSAQGSYTIVWRYNDGNGNITTQTQTVVIDDTIPPVPNVASLPVFRRPCYATTAMISKPYATDNCGGSGCGVSSIRGTTNAPASFTTAGTYTIVWTYTDANGNSSTQNQTVIVDDSIAPVPNVSSLPVINRQCSYTVAYPYPSATDNCRGSIAGSPSQTTFTTQGTHTLVWTYNDQNGNIRTQNQTIIIQDTTRPTISCRGTTNSPYSVGLNANGTLTLSSSMASSMIYYASDNCGGTPTLSITSGQTTFGCSNVGQMFTIGITATDASGNTATCSSVIRIVPGNGNDDDCDGVHNACDVCPGGNDAVDNNNDGYPDCKYPPAYANVKQSWKCGNNKVYVWYRNNNNNYSTTCIQYSNVQSLINAGQIWLGAPSYCCNAKAGDVTEDSSPFLLHDDADRILLAPNPASERLNISLIGVDDGIKTLRITDQLGKVVFTTTMAADEDNLEIDLSSASISNGVYMVHIETPNQRVSKGFVVVR